MLTQIVNFFASKSQMGGGVVQSTTAPPVATFSLRSNNTRNDNCLHKGIESLSQTNHYIFGTKF